MSVLDELPERDLLPQFCPNCSGAISQEWSNDVTDTDEDRVEGYECVNCSWRCRIVLPAVEVER